jgi:hypothetical protein
MPMFQTYLMASVLVLAPAGVMAQNADRVVPLRADPVAKFLTPLSDDGFVDGRSDEIPELTEEAVVAFFGERRMRVLNDDPLADQAMIALSGPPFDRIDLGNGYYVSVACSIGNCGERGAVVMDGTGRIVAAQLIGYRCRKKPAPRCDDLPVAYAFIDGDLPGDIVEPVFVEWAAMSFDEVDRTNQEYFPDLPSVERVLRVVEM